MRGEFVDIDGARLYCYAFGSRGAGVPIVLIHGSFTSSHLWQDVLPLLPKGHRVLVLDLLGHGRSDRASGREMTVAAHADRLRGLLNELSVSAACVVGHGLGAAIAVRFAHASPARVSQLALVNPALVAESPRDIRIPGSLKRLAALTPLWRKLPGDWIASALHTALLRGYAQRSVGAHSLDLYLKPFRTREGRDSACLQLRALKASMLDTNAALVPGALAAATSVVFGDEDPFLSGTRATGLVSSLQAATNSRTTAHYLNGVAHVAPEEAPDRLATIIGELLTRA